MLSAIYGEGKHYYIFNPFSACIHFYDLLHFLMDFLGGSRSLKQYCKPLLQSTSFAHGTQTQCLFQVVFGFSQYTSISEVDSACSSVTLIGGSCAAGAALSQCKSALFEGDAGGKARVLVVLIAGSSSDDVASAAGSLKSAGVKIIAVGMGGSFVQSQLAAMAFSSSYVLTATSYSGLAGITGSITGLISQGTMSGQCLRRFHFLIMLKTRFHCYVHRTETPYDMPSLVLVCNPAYIKTLTTAGLFTVELDF